MTSTTRTPLFLRLRRSRARFDDVRSWLLGLYSGLLLRLRSWPLPCRGRAVRVRFGGRAGAYAVRLGTSDLLVAAELFEDREYDPVLGAGLRDVRVVLDLGANIGLSVRLWQERFPGARIVAVEPDEANAELCRLNAALGPDPARVTILRAAAAGVRRPLALDRAPAGGEWGHRAREARSVAEPGDVEGITIPDVMDRAGLAVPIDLLKCDIEGAEAEVFRDAAAWAWSVRHLVVELHAPYTRAAFEADLDRARARFDLRTIKRAGPVEVVFGSRVEPRPA